MDLPSQPLVPPPATLPAPAKKSSLAGKIIPIIVILVLIVAGLFAARFFLQLSKKSHRLNLLTGAFGNPESIIKPLIDEYQTAHPKIKINYVFQSPPASTVSVCRQLSACQGPDIFRIHNSWIPMFKNDLSPVPPVYSASEFESTFYPTAKSDLRLSGNYMAVPLEIDGLAMFVNDDLLAKSGQSVPASWEDLRSAAKALSVCDSADGTCSTGDRILISGAALGTTDNVDHWQDILAVLMLQNNVNLNLRPAHQPKMPYLITPSLPALTTLGILLFPHPP